MRRNVKPRLTPEREIFIVKYAEPAHPKKARYKMLDNLDNLSEFPKNSLFGLEKLTIGGVELDGLMAASDAGREYHLMLLYKGSGEEHSTLCSGK